MAAVGQIVTIGTTATLVFEVVDGITYAGLTSPAANIFRGADNNAPLPILLGLPASTSIYFGGSTVTSSSTTIGALFNGSTMPTLAYNCVGGDSLYAVVASSTAPIQLLCLRQ